MIEEFIKKVQIASNITEIEIVKSALQKIAMADGPLSNRAVELLEKITSDKYSNSGNVFTNAKNAGVDPNAGVGAYVSPDFLNKKIKNARIRAQTAPQFVKNVGLPPVTVKKNIAKTGGYRRSRRRRRYQTKKRRY